MNRDASNPKDGPNSDRALLRRADQAAIAVILAISGCVMAASVLLPGWRHGGVIDLETAEPTSLQFLVDVNTASWPELALLPGIGEVRARSIVQSRELEGPFVDLDQLKRVEGIGPKTLAAIKPYLLPLPDTHEVAGH